MSEIISNKTRYKAGTCTQSLVLGLLAGAIMAGFLLAIYHDFIFIPIEDEFRFRDDRRVEDHEKLISIYNAADLGEDLAIVARKVIERVDGRRLDINFDDTGRNANLRVAFSRNRVFGYSGNSFMGNGWDKWVLTLCFAAGQLEGAYFGTDSAVDVTPDAAPSPKGECTWSPPPQL